MDMSRKYSGKEQNFMYCSKSEANPKLRQSPGRENLATDHAEPPGWTVQVCKNDFGCNDFSRKQTN